MRIAGAALAALYLAMMLPRTLASADWNYTLTMRVRNLVESVAGAQRVHPGKTIVLEGVDAELFWNAILDRPFRLIGNSRVYLAPGSEVRIPPQPNLGDPAQFILPAEAARNAIDRGEAVVYDASGPQLRNITSTWTVRPQDAAAPRRLDAADPVMSYLLGPEWYAAEGNHRWMPKRATLRIGGPSAEGQRLYLEGIYPSGGAPTVTVTAGGIAFPPEPVRSGQSSDPGVTAFALSFPLPATLVGKASIEVSIEVSRTIRIGADTRDLGLAFGTFAVR